MTITTAYARQESTRISESFRDLQVVLVGDASVGKTHLLSRYMKDDGLKTSFPALHCLIRACSGPLALFPWHLFLSEDDLPKAGASSASILLAKAGTSGHNWRSTLRIA